MKLSNFLTLGDDSVAPSFQRGSGSPNGVKTANPSSLYMDTTNGAHWLKSTGTGNTGWVQVGPIGTVYATMTATGALTTRIGQSRWYNDTGRTLTVTAIRIAVGTSPTGAAILVDVNKNGTTMYTTQGNRPTVAISGNTQKATQPDVLTVADGDYLTIDIDQVGSTIAGSDLSLTVWLTG